MKLAAAIQRKARKRRRIEERARREARAEAERERQAGIEVEIDEEEARGEITPRVLMRMSRRSLNDWAFAKMRADIIASLSDPPAATQQGNGQ
jgi:hypothetical protein